MKHLVKVSDIYLNHTHSYEQLQNINSALNEAAIVAITDRNGIILSANDYFCNISQYSREELVGQNHRILNSGTHSSEFFKDLWETIYRGETWHGEICNRAKDGSLYWVQTTIVPIKNAENEIEQFISIRVDITAQKNFERMNYLMFHDELTNLPNRKQLVKDIDKLIELQKPFSIFLLDLNRFKVINEHLGHDIADQFLIEIADFFKNLYGQQFYRLHSDEFVVVVEEPNSEDDAMKNVTYILNKFMQKQTIGVHEFYSSVSIGVCHYPEHGNTSGVLLKHADIAMIEAKKVRGNHFTIYRPSKSPQHAQPLAFEAKIRHAIANDLFTVYYQPKYNFTKERFDGIEALIRWQDEELGSVSPMEFIPFAEKFGFIEEIEEWVIRRVLQDIEYWDETYGKKMHVAINISPAHIAKNSFCDRLSNLMKASTVSPSQIELEITETSIFDINNELVNKLKRLRKEGFTISIDDFGTGFTCLKYLQVLPVNKMKIDRSFIAKSTLSEYGRNMTLSILSLGQALKLEIVAEGVETQEEYDLLKHSGCQYMQGYYMAKPMPQREINTLIEQNKFYI